MQLTLRAWYLPPRNGAVIILLPGAGGAREGLLSEGAILARHDYSMLMTELRSCAHPEGQTTLGYREAADLTEAVTWVYDQPGVAHVGVLGYSLGGVTADVSPISVVDRISPRPLLLIYGELEAGETHAWEQLARAGEPKDLWIVPGCWHRGYLDIAPEEWERRVVAFFDGMLLSER